MTNKEWLATLSAEDWYSTVHWLFHVYGKRYTDTYSAILSWLNETHNPTTTKICLEAKMNEIDWAAVERYIL